MPPPSLPAVLAGLAIAAILAVPMGMLLPRVVGRFAPGTSATRAIPAALPVIATVGIFVAVAAWSLTVAAPWPPATRLVVTVAYLAFAAVGLALTAVDALTHRLPNALVVPAIPVAATLSGVASAVGADWYGFARALTGGAVLFALYFTMRLLGAGIGGGDVKLAALVGVMLGWIGWGALVVGGVAAFVLGGAYGAVLLALRRTGRRTRVPFGPWMLAGAWCGILIGEPFAGWYLGGGAGA